MWKKQLGYWFYGLVSHLFGVLPVQKGKVVGYLVHNDHFQGNMKYLFDAMQEKGEKKKFVVVSKQDLFQGSKWNKIKGAVYFYLVLNYHFSTAEEIYLNDNFLPLAYMRLHKKTKVVQLWHGIGAWKRFGLSTEEDETTKRAVKKGNQKITHLFVSGEQVVPFYKEAFGIAENRIYPTGLPVLDFYFSKEKLERAKAQVYEEYPNLKGKKIALYTPTFRKTEAENINLLSQLEGEQLEKQLGEEWVILLRLHPSLQGIGLSIPTSDRMWNVSHYPDVKELYAVADVLINDYSSTMVEFSLLRKPIVLFAYDLEAYDRGFYADYQTYAPGPIVRTLEDLAKAIVQEKIDEEKYQSFVKLHYSHEDGENAKRVLEIMERC